MRTIWIRKNFYPRSPCGERRNGYPHTRRHDAISIHALLAESDIAGRITSNGTKISIHALLAESDRPMEVPQYQILISIHALLAESDACIRMYLQCSCRFLSTLSLRRATIHYDNYNLHCVISIHALLAESDLIQAMPHLMGLLFLSTLSLRRATCYQWLQS